MILNSFSACFYGYLVTKFNYIAGPTVCIVLIKFTQIFYLQEFINKRIQCFIGKRECRGYCWVLQSQLQSCSLQLFIFHFSLHTYTSLTRIGGLSNIEYILNGDQTKWCHIEESIPSSNPTTGKRLYILSNGRCSKWSVCITYAFYFVPSMILNNNDLIRSLELVRAIQLIDTLLFPF